MSCFMAEPGQSSWRLAFAFMRFQWGKEKGRHYRFVKSLSFRNNAYLLLKNYDGRAPYRDLPAIFLKLASVFFFYLIYEPFVFLQIGPVIKNFPKMIHKRAALRRGRESCIAML